jgi:hypothetical protein
VEQSAQEGSHMSDVLLFESPIRLTDWERWTIRITRNELL